MASKPTALIVCWKPPAVVPDGARVLSFLSPADEEVLKGRLRDPLLSGREFAQRIKEQAKSTYLTLVANAGAAALVGDRSLRQRLQRANGVSSWWFHEVAGKDCENHDPTFRFVIELHTIAAAATSCGISRITLVGGHEELADVLRGRFTIGTERGSSRYSSSYLLAGVVKRIKYAAAFLVKWGSARGVLGRPRDRAFDVVLSGFWDWSVKIDRSGVLRDRFFGMLPAEFVGRGLSVGWLLWFDPFSEPTAKRRSTVESLQPLRGRDDVVVLQLFLGAIDLLKTIFDVRPLIQFLRTRRSAAYRQAFVLEGIDYYPLLRHRLLRGFLDASIPHLTLVSIASERAFKAYRPKLALSFLDLFPFPRAFYAGGRAGHATTLHGTVQHATYNGEEAFALLHPEIEYRGRTDNCPIPAPDVVFAMGELGRSIFRENGFPDERIFLTGSPRYQHVRLNAIDRRKKGDSFNVLIAASMGVESELEMVEAACLAAEGVPGIKLRLRNHPFARVDRHPRFSALAGRLEVVEETLEESLRSADLILITYSSVGEEAILSGIPVWQWLTSSYNGSAFRDVKVVPSFHSVSDLNSAFRNFQMDRAEYEPHDDAKAEVLLKCFYKGDGKAAARIAEICNQLLKRAAA